MANREWKAEYKGHPIRVVNKFSLFPFATSEILEIDGAIIEHKEGGLFRLTSTMKATYNFDGQEQEVEIRIAQKTDSLRVGCQIFIESQLIGGDQSIRYIKGKKAENEFKNAKEELKIAFAEIKSEAEAEYEYEAEYEVEYEYEAEYERAKISSEQAEIQTKIAYRSYIFYYVNAFLGAVAFGLTSNALDFKSTAITVLVYGALPHLITFAVLFLLTDTIININVEPGWYSRFIRWPNYILGTGLAFFSLIVLTEFIK